MTNIKMNNDINVLEFYDSEDDIILPDTILGELYYIYCNLEDIILNRCDRKKEWFNLKRQIRIYIKWRRNK
ncbi:hypothetical protein IJ674_10800 [bacterium]|nr:hypothetical protein [bacterium]MBR1620363.1 hypothetical protein [bacterium]